MEDIQDPRDQRADDGLYDLLHDLRTPLAVIIGSADLVLRSDEGAGSLDPNMERIRRCARDCRRLLDRFSQRLREARP